jgi:hypothetical protein
LLLLRRRCAVPLSFVNVNNVHFIVVAPARVVEGQPPRTHQARATTSGPSNQHGSFFNPFPLAGWIHQDDHR